MIYDHHYNYVIMGTMASKKTSLAIVYSTVYSGGDKRTHQSSVSLAFVRGIHRSPVDSPHKGPVMRKMFPFDDVIMMIANMMLLHAFIYSSFCRNGELNVKKLICYFPASVWPVWGTYLTLCWHFKSIGWLFTRAQDRVAADQGTNIVGWDFIR